MRLYEMSFAMQALIDQIESIAAENEGVIPDELAAEVEKLEGEKSEKVLNICRVIKNIETDADAIAKELKTMQQRKRSKDAQIAWWKNYLSLWAKGERYEDGNSALSWRKSQAVIVTDETAIPDAYCKFTREPSKTLIKDAIEAGAEIQGAKVVESLNPQIK